MATVETVLEARIELNLTKQKLNTGSLKHFVLKKNNNTHNNIMCEPGGVFTGAAFKKKKKVHDRFEAGCSYKAFKLL